METKTGRDRMPGGRGAAALALGLLSGCGAGVAGVAASAGGESGGTTPALDVFAVEGPKVSPCRLRLDASQAVRVGLFFDLGRGDGTQALTRLEGTAGNVVDLPASEVTLEWDFAREPGLAASYTPGVKLVALRGGAPIGGGTLELGLGNDAPEVLSIDQIDVDPDSGEASGTTGIEITVADSSDDVVDVTVEFDVQGDVPDAGWQLARPALVDPGKPTPRSASTTCKSGARAPR